MDVQVAETGPCRRTLTIRVPAQDLQGRLDAAFRQAAQQVRLKGFRAGQVPRKVLEKKFGSEIRGQAKEQVLNESFRDACREHEIQVVGRIDLEGVGDGPLDEKSDLEFTVHVDVRPDIEIADLAGLTVDAKPTEVTDEDIDNALGQLADSKKTLESVDAEVEENDFLTADIEFRNEAGESVQKKEGIPVSPNIPVAGTDPEAFKQTLVGTEKGATVEVDLTYPETFEVEGVRGQGGKVAVTVREVKRVQAPARDDAFAKEFGFDSLDALKEEMQKRIGEEKVRAERVRQENALLDALAARHHFPLPESMVEDQMKGRLDDFEKRMKEGGLEETAIQQKLEEAKEEARTEAERSVRLFFLIDAIAQQQEVRVEQSDIEAELRGIAARYEADYEEVREHFVKENRIRELQMAVVERKVRELLREKATISDTKET